jgi:hypothetical protein
VREAEGAPAPTAASAVTRGEGQAAPSSQVTQERQGSGNEATLSPVRGSSRRVIRSAHRSARTGPARAWAGSA